MNVQMAHDFLCKYTFAHLTDFAKIIKHLKLHENVCEPLSAAALLGIIIFFSVYRNFMSPKFLPLTYN